MKWGRMKLCEPMMAQCDAMMAHFQIFQAPKFQHRLFFNARLGVWSPQNLEQFYPADPSCNVQGLGEYLRRQLQLSLPPAFFGLSGARWLMKLVELCVFWLIQYVSRFNDVQAMGAT